MKRTIEINKTKLWCVSPSVKTELTDDDGNYTGEFTSTFGTPTVVYLSLYPFSGAISEQIFGKDASFDMIAVSNSVDLSKDSLLFLTEPVSNYATTYDYRVRDIKASKNTKQYGLTRRT